VAPANTSQGKWPGPKATQLFTSARSCVTALHTQSAANLDGGLVAIDRCATGEFAEQLRNVRAQIRESLSKSGATMTVRAIEVGLLAVQRPDQATVLVSADTDTRTSKGNSTNAVRYRAEMRHIGERWLISNLEPVS
jgi:hypothetical protein